MFIRNRKGQSTAEYAIVIGLVIAAAVAMQVYVKRGLQGKVKDAVDATTTETMDSSSLNFSTGQYEPEYLTTNMQASRNASESESALTGGGVSRNVTDASSRTGTQSIAAANEY